MNQEVSAPLVSSEPYAILPGFTSRDDCRHLAGFTQELYDRGLLTRNVFQINTWNARIDLVHLRPCGDDRRWEICQQILDGICRTVLPGPRVMDPVYGDFLSFMTAGGLVRPHRDDWKMDLFAERWPEPCQVRCNLFLQKEPGSGDPLLVAGEGPAQRMVPVGPLGAGDLLVFSPTLSIHAANRVLGIPRIMASFSFLMARQTFLDAVAAGGGASAGIVKPLDPAN